MQFVNLEEEKQVKHEEEDAPDVQAPADLLRKFLAAVNRRDLNVALLLCQMILIYEPENPEASEFLLLIQKKLLEKRCEDDAAGEETDSDDDDDDDPGSDGVHCSLFSSSSFSSSDAAGKINA
ncbi:glutamate-rich protein 2 isoform X1 [Cynoglossus semilaevis]|uniref:glutamate-rich protein 2 isoform X1 n=1 Tax=Cynoglossus semilaevis TaxID=244447 RepID=UPI000495EFE3|nr:glutamate-rich protein 2 isoform X1 [Cynoglossus semilaevis]